MSQRPPGPPGVPPPGARYLPPPMYLPGQQSLPPRRRQPRHSPVIAPVLALLGLLIVAGASYGAFTFLSQREPEPATGVVVDSGEKTPAPAGSADPAAASPDPTDEPVVPTDDPALPSLAPNVAVAPINERPDIKGTILFSRDEDIWSASGTTLSKLTGNSSDHAPTWSHDGKSIYYIHINRRTTSNSRPGGLYTLFVPEIMRMNADGTDKKRIYNGFISGPGGQWFSHVLQPDISPDGKTLAVVSDGSNGSGEAVVLHLLSSKPNSKLRKVASASSLGSLGHNDPEWSPDGRQIAYTRNQNAGTTGAPRVTIHTCKSKKDCTSGKSRRLRPGYASPSWSPDGSWLAVEATKGLGRDIAIVNSKRGDPRVFLTTDGDSFAPVVSPDGDQIAYLRRDGLDIDLRVMTLDFDEDGKITLVDDRAVTVDGAIDAESPPAWYIPRSERTQAVEPQRSAEISAPPSEAP